MTNQTDILTACRNYFTAANAPSVGSAVHEMLNGVLVRRIQSALDVYSPSVDQAMIDACAAQIAREQGVVLVVPAPAGWDVAEPSVPPDVQLVNEGSETEPRWRVKVDGVTVAGRCPLKSLEALADELRANGSKAVALRDFKRAAEPGPEQMTDCQLQAARDRITSRIATYRQPGVPVREEDAAELEAVMGQIEARRVAAEITAFEANPHGWTDENGMRYRCNRCHAPMLSLLPAELTSGACKCGGLIEADPRNFGGCTCGGRSSGEPCDQTCATFEPVIEAREAEGIADCGLPQPPEAAARPQIFWRDVTPNVSARSEDGRFGVRICHLSAGWRWLAYDHNHEGDCEFSGNGFATKEEAQAACAQQAGGAR